MNNPNPFVPKGSLLEQQSQRRSRLKIAVGCVLVVSILGLIAMLIQGCKREQPVTENNVPPPDLGSNAAPAANASLPPPEMATNPLPPVPTNPVAVAPPLPTPPPPPPPVEPSAPAATTYEVVAGDTLAKIAKAQGVTLKALRAANPGVDPRKLKPKQKLNIPAKSTETTAAAPATVAGGSEAGEPTYTVKSGDTLSKVAKKNGVTLKALRAANPKYASTDHIHVGEKLVIPAKSEAGAPATAPETPVAPVTPPGTSMAPTSAPTAAPGH